MKIPQDRADFLLQMEKHALGTQYNFPTSGGKLAIPLVSADGREDFLLDIYRGGIAICGSFQNRVYITCILARLCFGGKPHTNPDGETIQGTHIHIYREGYGDKWAYPLPNQDFPVINDTRTIFSEFMRFCNITKQPSFISPLL